MTRTVIARAALAAALAQACGGSEPAARREEQPPTGEAAAAPGGLRRLLRRQYINSVRVLLGRSAALAATPPDDASLHGFDAVGAVELSLPPSAVDAYEASARAVARAAVNDPDALAQLVPCAPSGPLDTECHRRFIARFGRLAWRRPLSQAEVDRFAAIARAAAAAYGAFEAGVEVAISALLQSPSFLYLVEIGDPDPSDPATRRLNSRELVARLSFFLLDQTPDADLLDVASRAELDADDVRALARSMLAKPEAKTALAAFYSELLGLRGLEAASKDRALFPRWRPALAEAMKEEVLRLVEDVVWTRDADARDLLTADHAFVNADLAALYGVPPPPGEQFVRTALPAEQGRSGLLGAAAFLARSSHPDRTSPTRRGRFVREVLLCEEVPPPPPGVDATVPGPDGASTLRARLERHVADPSCNGCHGLVDPIGFAMESFDAIGAFRRDDGGLPIDTAKAAAPELGAFANEKELGALLHDDPRVPRCVVKNLVRSALGSVDASNADAVVDALTRAFAASGYRMKELLVELVASPAFRLVKAPR